MGNFTLNTWQTVLIGILYAGYLCWVMFGGLRKRRVKPWMYLIMTILMVYGVIHEYTGIHTGAEIADISIILGIGLIKGVVLGRMKVVEKIDDVWYMHHTGKYIVLWVIFFGIKLLATRLLSYYSGVTMPWWHLILYFAFYYPWRTTNVFIHNPEMRKEVLSGMFKRENRAA